MTWSREMSQLSKISLPIFLHHSLINSFWCKPHYNWISGCRLQSYEEFVNAKNNIYKGIWTLFLQISHNQYRRHPTHSSWSCHILLLYLMEAQHLQFDQFMNKLCRKRKSNVSKSIHFWKGVWFWDTQAMRVAPPLKQQIILGHINNQGQFSIMCETVNIQFLTF